MRKHFCMLSLAGAACLWSVGAVGQTKIAWSDSCSKPDPAYEVKVGDPASHSLGLAQVKCHATKPAEIGGDKSKEAVSTYAYDASGDKSREHGIYVLSLESGDMVSLPYQGTITLKDSKITSARGTWSFADGTGKLKGIKGKGTWHCSPMADGGFSCGGEGEYELTK